MTNLSPISENGDLKIFDADSDGDNDVIAYTKNSYLVNNNSRGTAYSIFHKSRK